MNERSIKLFTLLGFEVKVGFSWVFLAVLVTWSLGVGFFPAMFPGLSPASYWGMGALGALGLFISIIFHELCHSLVGRLYAIPIRGITLFIFGGVAELQDEPPSAGSEFLMAIAGPISSFVLAGVAYVAFLWGQAQGWATAVVGVAYYLAVINAVLATFNLLPAFPLDGGRALRAALWRWKGDVRWATRWAANGGKLFGGALIALGLFSLIGGNFIGGLWWILIGFFLHGAARANYHQLLVKAVLGGEPVRRFMNNDPAVVAPETDLQSFVEHYVYKFHYKMFPVVEGGRLLGAVSTRQVKAVPREEWAGRTVGELTQPCTADNTVAPTQDAMKVLTTMSRTGQSRLMVVDGERLVGVIALKDLLSFLQLKLDLEDDAA
jgi:Zn-dependent protease/CBS domain-containing protein